MKTFPSSTMFQQIIFKPLTMVKSSPLRADTTEECRWEARLHLQCLGGTRAPCRHTVHYSQKQGEQALCSQPLPWPCLVCWRPLSLPLCHLSALQTSKGRKGWTLPALCKADEHIVLGRHFMSARYLGAPNVLQAPEVPLEKPESSQEIFQLTEEIRT